MLIDGVKMACEACIRGHRVSGCTHTDRKLVAIAKKGRPVTQCGHCRSLRKSRSAHVKCDCAERYAARKEKKNKSASAIEASTKKASATTIAEGDAGSHAGVVACTSSTPDDESKSVSATCQCCHGGRCTCALKKDPQLSAVPEYPTPESIAAMYLPRDGSPRLPMTRSDSSLATFANSATDGATLYPVPLMAHGRTYEELVGFQNSPVPLVMGPSPPPHLQFGRTQSDPSPPPPARQQQQLRRIKSEQSSPDSMLYPALQMSTGTDTITELELTPRHSHQAPKPSKPRIHRTASGRIQTGLNINTSHHFSTHNFPSSELLVSADSEYQFSAGLCPPASAGWPPFMNPLTSFGEEIIENHSPAKETQVDAFLRIYNGSTEDVPALTNSTSGDEPDGSCYGVPSGPSPPYIGPSAGVFSSDSSEFGDQDGYALSTTSSFVGLHNLASGYADTGVTFERAMMSRPDFNQELVFPFSEQQQEMGPFMVAGGQDVRLQQSQPQEFQYQSQQEQYQQLQAQQNEYSEAVQQSRAATPGAEAQDEGDILWMAPSNQNSAFQ